jgi:hypothetical protein
MSVVGLPKMPRARHAAPMTFVVYAVLTLLAAVPTIPVTMAAGGASLHTTRGGGAFLELFETSAPAVGVGVLAGLVVAFLVWVLSPLLQMAWLDALSRPVTVADAIAFGTSQYLRAVGVTAILCFPLAVVCIATVVPPVLAHLALADHPNARTHDFVLLMLAFPGFFLWLAWCAWHDLARAALLRTDRPIDAVRVAFGRLGARAFGVYLVWTTLAGAIALLAHIIGVEVGSGVGLVLLLQPLALARVACRAAWLADATDRTRKRPPPLPLALP